MRAVAIASVLALASCAVVGQPSVRSASVDCSTSRFYYITDLLIATGTAIAASRVPEQRPELYAPSGVFAASALIGMKKRSNCVRWRRDAPPEEWARVADERRRRQEAARLAELEAQQRAEAARQAALQALLAAPPPAPEPDDGPQPGDLLRKRQTQGWDPPPTVTTQTHTAVTAGPSVFVLRGRSHAGKSFCETHATKDACMSRCTAMLSANAFGTPRPTDAQHCTCTGPEHGC